MDKCAAGAPRARARGCNARFGSVARCEALGRHVLPLARSRGESNAGSATETALRGTRGQPLYPSGRADDPVESLPGGVDAPGAVGRGAGGGERGRRGRRESGRRRPSCLGFFLRRFVRRRRRALWPLGRVVWWKRPTGRRAVVRPRRRFWSVVTENARSDRETKTKKLEGKARSYSEELARATAGVLGAMATGDASPRGFYSAEAADEDRVWRRHARARR